MNDHNVDERLSALVDGELSSQELEQLLASEQPLTQTWTHYHCVGEALRGHADGILPADSARVAAIMSLVRQTPVQALSDVLPDTMAVPAAVAPQGVSQHAANDAVFRWKLVAGVASLATVAALAWQMMGGAPNANGPQLAQAPQASPAVAAAPVVVAQNEVESPRWNEPAEQLVVSDGVIRDTRLDELMAAHRQLGRSALQMPAGFLRNATFETSQR